MQPPLPTDPTQGLNPLAQAVQTPPPQPTPEDILAATDKALMKKQNLAEQQQNDNFSQAQISTAMAQLSPNSKSPQVGVGKAVATPAYAGYCQQFVDDSSGVTQRYPTAAATWQAKVQSGEGQTDVSKAKPGDVIEFAPDSSNQGLGHAALVTKDGLKMATDNGVQTFSLKDWINYTGQTPSGFYTPSK